MAPTRSLSRSRDCTYGDGRAVAEDGVPDPACPATTNLLVTRPLVSTLTVPARSTKSLSDLGVPQAQWPVLTMPDLLTNQALARGRLSRSGTRAPPRWARLVLSRLGPCWSLRQTRRRLGRRRRRPLHRHFGQVLRPGYPDRLGQFLLGRPGQVVSSWDFEPKCLATKPSGPHQNLNRY